MTDVRIDYEHPVFDLEVETEGKLSRLSSHEYLDIFKVDFLVEELRDKFFDVYIFERDVALKENISFEQLQALSNERAFKDDLREVKVRDPDNIVSFSLGKIDILAKDVEPFKEVLKKEFTKKFNFAIAYKGYPEFIRFFGDALDRGCDVVLDEEFSGTLLKFSQAGKFVKAVYIKNEKIELLDSYSEKYKELQLKNIKEALEKVNEKLELEGKKPLGLEWKDE